MISQELQKKIDRAIKLLQGIGKGYDGDIEVAYSGGKDSDVILQLAKESGIRYRAIYKNTTIDPAGTLKHCKDMGAEVIKPKKNFFELVADNGFPGQFMRFCCRYLKEYKVLDKAIMGVRKAESTKRNARYNEPTECRYYGKKSPENHVEAIYPILDWTDEDVREFIIDRNIQLAPHYYDADGSLHTERRLGCMCCPLASKNKRIAQFKQWPNMVKAYIRAGQKFRDTHPNAKNLQKYSSVYEWFVRDVFYETEAKWQASKGGLFDEEIDYKAFLEKQFGIDLTFSQK